MSKIIDLRAIEVFDSRGVPTIQTEVWTEKGGYGKALVPSGASTGSREVLELRDEEEKRFLGKGVLRAINNINSEELIKGEIVGMKVDQQSEIDQKLIALDEKLDKTQKHNKAFLGGNTILSVSLASAAAAANEKRIPLFKYLRLLFRKKTISEIDFENEKFVLPVPQVNIINGGKHANNSLDFQEFMLVPLKANTFKEAFQIAFEIFYNLKEILNELGLAQGVGDEGGFSGNFENVEQVFHFLTLATNKAGYNKKEDDLDVMFAIDCAASEIYLKKEDIYYFKGESFICGKTIKRTKKELINYYVDLVNKYPIISIEDPFVEDDWESFAILTNKIGSKVQIVGDDLFVTNSRFLQRGIDTKAANAVLVKLNQIGTLTETIETVRLAKKNNFSVIISHRSGETEDTFIADLAVALNTGQIKIGSVTRSERIAKYNRLVNIETESRDNLLFAGKDVFKKFLNNHE